MHFFGKMKQSSGGLGLNVATIGGGVKMIGNMGLLVVKD